MGLGSGCPWSREWDGRICAEHGLLLPPTPRSAFTNEFCSTLLSWTQPPCCVYSLGGLNPCGAEVWLPRSALGVSCTSAAASSCVSQVHTWPSCVGAGDLRGHYALGCTQQMLLCCWVREAAPSECSVLALTQQRFLLAIPQIPNFSAPSPEPSAGTCGGLERAVWGGGSASVRFCLFTDVFEH